jgi:hypothetical protein
MAPRTLLLAAAVASACALAASAASAAASSATGSAASAAASSATASTSLPSASLPQVCLLYVDSADVFRFGAVTSKGGLSILLNFSTWGSVENGIAGGEETDSYVLTPGINAASKRSSASLRAGAKAGAAPQELAVLRVTSNTTATVKYAPLQPAPGHPGAGSDAIALMNVDEARRQMVAVIEGTSSLFFYLADVSPSNGSVLNVWRDFTSEWSTWAYMKYGVSAFDQGDATTPGNGVFYLVAGLPPNTAPVQTVVGLPLNGTKGPSFPLPAGHDIYSLRFSTHFNALVILTTDVSNPAKPSMMYWRWGGSTWTKILEYPADTVASMQLGMSEISTDGTVFISTLQIASTGQFFVSYVDLVAGKEVKRVLLTDKDVLPADVALCSVVA